MSDAFLLNVMQVIKTIAKADRSLAVDGDMNLMGTDNVSEEDLETPSFSSFALDSLQEALDTGTTNISNNVIADLSEAPTTNTNFANLRMLVSFPVDGHGAIYIDQSVRRGVISKDKVALLMELIQYLLDNDMEEASVEDMQAVFDEVITAS